MRTVGRGAEKKSSKDDNKLKAENKALKAKVKELEKQIEELEDTVAAFKAEDEEAVGEK